MSVQENNQEESQIQMPEVQNTILTAIHNTYTKLAICKIIEAEVINIKSDDTPKHELQSADIRLLFSLPRLVELEKLTYKIEQTFSISSVVTELSIGAVGLYDSENLAEESHKYSITVPLFRGSKERAFLDRFHSQEKIIQHHCFIIQGVNYNYRVRTSINFESNEISIPEVGTTFVDTRRINDILANTKLTLTQLKYKTKEMFISCNERRKKGTKQTDQQVYSLPVPDQTAFVMNIAGMPNEKECIFTHLPETQSVPVS